MKGADWIVVLYAPALFIALASFIFIFHRVVGWFISAFSRRPFRCSRGPRWNSFPKDYKKWFEKHGEIFIVDGKAINGLHSGHHYSIMWRGWVKCEGWMIPVKYEVGWSDPKRTYGFAGLDLPPLEDDKLMDVEKYLCGKNLSIADWGIDTGNIEALSFKIEKVMKEYGRRA